MKEHKVFDIARIWLISLVALDLISFIYVLVIGRTSGYINFGDTLTFVFLAIILATGVFSVVVTVFSFTTKKYVAIWYSVGLVFAGVFLWLLILIIALSQIF